MIRIVAVNSKYVHTLLAPYYLKENCAVSDIDILQCNINEDIDDLYSKIIKDLPKVICFSCYIFNINVVLRLAKMLKDNCPEVIVVFGGPEVSFDAINYVDADYVIVGEGEEAFSRLMSQLVEGILPKDKVIIGECVDLNTIKPPYTQQYFEDCTGKIAYFEASRGCVFNCAYCMSGKSRLRKFPMEYVQTQLDKFCGRDIRVLKFVDRTFNADSAFATQIMTYLLNDKFAGLTFHFEIAADILKEEFFEVVAKAPKGKFMFEIGVQSFNEKTLESVVRKSDLNKVENNIQRLVGYGNSNIHTDLIAGLPYEGLQSFVTSFNKLYALGGDMLQLGFLKALKGSQLREDMDKNVGYLYGANPPYEIVSTPFITQEELDIVRKVEDCVDGYYNSGYFKSTLSRYIGDNAFEFFLGLAKYQRSQQLFYKYDAIKKYLVDNGNCEKEVISWLKYDYLTVNNSKVMPPCLKVKYTQNEIKRMNALKDFTDGYITVLDINPTNGNIGKCYLQVDYSESPYRCTVYEY